MAATLAELVAPNDTSDFLRQYWTAAPLHIPGAPARFRHLFGWDSFNALLNSHYRHIAYPGIRMCMDSVHLDKTAFSETTRTSSVTVPANMRRLQGAIPEPERSYHDPWFRK